jgi:hypothetical protein
MLLWISVMHMLSFHKHRKELLPVHELRQPLIRGHAADEVAGNGAGYWCLFLRRPRYLFVRCDNAPAPWTSDEGGDSQRLDIPSLAEKEIKQATGAVFEMGDNPYW